MSEPSAAVKKKVVSSMTTMIPEHDRSRTAQSKPTAMESAFVLSGRLIVTVVTLPGWRAYIEAGIVWPF